jgi:hypothetical protein
MALAFVAGGCAGAPHGQQHLPRGVADDARRHAPRTAGPFRPIGLPDAVQMATDVATAIDDRELMPTNEVSFVSPIRRGVACLGVGCEEDANPKGLQAQALYSLAWAASRGGAKELYDRWLAAGHISDAGLFWQRDASEVVCNVVLATSSSPWAATRIRVAARGARCGPNRSIGFSGSVMGLWRFLTARPYTSRDDAIINPHPEALLITKASNSGWGWRYEIAVFPSPSAATGFATKLRHVPIVGETTEGYDPKLWLRCNVVVTAVGSEFSQESNHVVPRVLARYPSCPTDSTRSTAPPS